MKHKTFYRKVHEAKRVDRGKKKRESTNTLYHK